MMGTSSSALRRSDEPTSVIRRTANVGSVIDLHTHSRCSDGSETPQRVVELAATAGCSALALTDHDTLAGLEVAGSEADRLGVELVRGCEISCLGGPFGSEAREVSTHVLVYFVPEEETPLHAELERLRSDRLTRNRRLVDRLGELGVAVDYDRIVAEAGGEPGLGRPHFAKALVESGVAEDTSDAFDRWLGQGGLAYVAKARLRPHEAAEIARASRAVAVLAHPLSLGLALGELSSFVGELAGAGFGGIEAIYGSYEPAKRRELEALASHHGLVATGGSDFHGTFKPGLSVGEGLGDLSVSDSVLESLAARVA